MLKAKARSTKTRQRASSKVSGKRPATVEDYLARVPEPARSALKRMRAAIRSAAPADALEVISYRIPAFKSRAVLVWYGAFADHVSLFPTAGIIEQFKDALKDFTTRKGTIQFPTTGPLPIPLIRAMVTARVAQIEAKTRR